MKNLLTTFEQQLRPEHAALLVIDMQNDFCAPGGFLQRERNYDISRTEGIARRIDTCVKAARAAGMPVVWIRSIYDFKYLSEADVVKRGQEGCCLENTWGADFFHLTPAAGEAIVDKHCYSGFNNTSLNETLRERGIRTLVVTGVATNVCVDSTLRDGFFLGYYIILLEDCVGSNSSAGHDGTLATVRNNIGTVTTSAAMIEALISPPLPVT